MKLAVIALAFVVSGCLTDLVDGDRTDPYDYIRDTKYKEWVIEVDYVEGMRPSASATQLLKARMESMVSKDTITVRVSDQAVAESRSSWTQQAILDLHKRTDDISNTGDRITTHVLYLDGRMSGDVRPLGVTFDWDLVVIFKEEINTACRPTNLCFLDVVEIERAVLVHEFGHAIGLVSRPVPMVRNHEDPEHEHHSSNENSVMYWAVESFARVSGLRSVPTQFDADDRRDICEAGGRPACDP